MNLDTVLEFGQRAEFIVSPPWGTVIAHVSGTVRASMPRIQKDLPGIVAFLNEVLPIIQKHWPTVGPEINDLLPIALQIAKDLKQ